MKRRSYEPARLDYPRALRRMFQGSKLVRTNGKRVEYAVSPGGPISNAAAQRILEHSLCHPADAGLLNDRPQSWEFNTSTPADT